MQFCLRQGSYRTGDCFLFLYGFVPVTLGVPTCSSRGCRRQALRRTQCHGPVLGASPRLFLGHGPPSQRSASLGRQPVPSSCHQFSWLGGHRGGPGQALNYKGRQRASRGDVAVLSSALHSSLFACNVLPVLRARLLHLCVWDNTWPDSGLIHPERLMLCSRFLLLLSPAVAGQGHSSTVMSTCD